MQIVDDEIVTSEKKLYTDKNAEKYIAMLRQPTLLL